MDTTVPADLNEAEMVFSRATMHDFTSSGTPFLFTMTGNDASVDFTTVMATTEKPYEEFAEVKAAVLIDRIYIPVAVIVGVVGNFLCFVTLVFSNMRTTSTCIYMAAIAVLDCVILVLDLCVLIRGYLGHTEFYISNSWTCGFHNFLFYFAIHFDVLLLLAMTVDRFIVVRFPLKAQSLCTPGSAVKAIIIIGLFSFSLNFQIFFTRRLGETGNVEDPLRCWYPDPEVDFFMRKIYTWIDASIYSFIPFLSLLVLNILIIRQLRSSIKFNRKFTGRRDGENASKGVNMKVVIDGDTMNSGMYTSNTDVSCTDYSTAYTDSVDESRNGASNDAKPDKGVYTISRKKHTNGADGSLGASKKALTNTNITVMLLLVSFTFLVLTSPVVIVLLYKRYYWLPSTNAEKARARLTHAFVDNIMYTNHAVNFLLYCISGRRFRVELKQLFARVCCRR